MPQNTHDKKVCSYSRKLSCRSSQGHTILNQKICQKPDFNFGFGSRDSKSSPRCVPHETQATELSFPFEVFSDRSVEGDSSMHFLTRSKNLGLPVISALRSFYDVFHKVYRVNAAIIQSSGGNCRKSLRRQREQRTICFSKHIFTVGRISHRHEELTRTCSVTRRCVYLRNLRFLPSQFNWCSDTSKMCYIFLQISPSRVGSVKTKLRLGYTSLLLFLFLSSPTFWKTRDQPEPGSFSHSSLWSGDMKDPGSEVRL